MNNTVFCERHLILYLHLFFILIDFLFLPRDAAQSAVRRFHVVCPSVCPSVCSSV